jgi:soluble lytic murein transglycosylase
MRRHWRGAAALGVLVLVTPLSRQLAPPQPAAPVQPKASSEQTSPVLALDPAPQPESAPAPVNLPPGLDLAGVADALRYYHEGEVESGDGVLKTADPLVRAAVEWDFLRFHPVEAGLERLSAFLRLHPDWPLAGLRKHAEDLASSDHTPPEKAAAYFSAFSPMTAGGRLAAAILAQAEPAQAETAAQTARELWRGADLSANLEKKLLKNFGGALSAADHLRRADRLVMREQLAGAARAAALAGKEGEALFRAEADLLHGAPWDKVSARVPAALRDSPGLLFVRIHATRHAEQFDAATQLLQGAPRASEEIAPEEWWVERRLLARKALDKGDSARAYAFCAGHVALPREAEQEAEFHAGWIALRFMAEPARAAVHFDRLAALAQTPHSAARAAYWRGRTAEARGADSEPFFLRAAGESETFYGQLARSRLGLDVVALTSAPVATEGEARAASVRAAELLFALGEKDAARALTLEAAASLPGEQMAALGNMIVARGDARLALLAGKSALHRFLKFRELTWPTNGAPAFAPLANSVGRPVVLAVARQESAFDPNAHSSAGAHGLMQMIPSTARKAAKQAGLAFDEAKLRDPAFNAQLGAFHLGQLLGEYRGSHILAFAAYNAGGGNVHDWIAAYGDPRDPKVDPIDWIERIPFSETRNYVQKVVENLHIYRARLGEPGPDLFRAEQRPILAHKIEN